MNPAEQQIIDGAARLRRENDELRAENERLRNAILSYGKGEQFDWDILGRIDELETELAAAKESLEIERAAHRTAVEKLQADLDGKCAVCCTACKDMLTDDSCVACERDELRAENERLKKVIREYGDGTYIGWQTLTKNARLETELAAAKERESQVAADVKALRGYITHVLACAPMLEPGVRDAIRAAKNYMNALGTFREVK